ncbi:hypothetical protein HS088_TW13G00142 [Tripterygium wilfordii]|uniref:AP2/ERF domain-containing protein n=1 Tax=Tripterygium wilfordii TaxID=458696 RepID=A0A7J7CT44_TRIWF|nr:hypothetical protein HS088_TW13G00142 [Tripterygium wilfordii]
MPGLVPTLDARSRKRSGCESVEDTLEKWKRHSEQPECAKEGVIMTSIEAAHAYDEAARAIHGPCARVNFPESSTTRKLPNDAPASRTTERSSTGSMRVTRSCEAGSGEESKTIQILSKEKPDELSPRVSEELNSKHSSKDCLGNVSEEKMPESAAGDGKDVEHDLQTDREFADVEVETSILKEEIDPELQEIMRLRSYCGFENRQDFLHNEPKKIKRNVHISSKDVEVQRLLKREEIEVKFRRAVESSGQDNLNNRYNQLHDDFMDSSTDKLSTQVGMHVVNKLLQGECTGVMESTNSNIFNTGYDGMHNADKVVHYNSKMDCVPSNHAEAGRPATWRNEVGEPSENIDHSSHSCFKDRYDHLHDAPVRISSYVPSKDVEFEMAIMGEEQQRKPAKRRNYSGYNNPSDDFVHLHSSSNGEAVGGKHLGAMSILDTASRRNDKYNSDQFNMTPTSYPQTGGPYDIFNHLQNPEATIEGSINQMERKNSGLDDNFIPCKSYFDLDFDEEQASFYSLFPDLGF